MFAIVQVGNGQFKISEGDTIQADRLEGTKGDEITFDKVLMLGSDKDVQIGQPFLKDIKITAKVVRHTLADKVTAFKYRKRKNSATKKGHRQKLTALSITKINVKK